MLDDIGWKRITVVVIVVLVWATAFAVCRPLTKRYDRFFKRYAVMYGVRPTWVKAVAIAESSLSPSAVSWVGARGLMQFMPATWEWQAPLQVRALGPNNPKAAIWAGCKYLRWNLDRVPRAKLPDGERLASASYNSGWGNVRKARAVCRGKKGCDPEVWYSNVEDNLVTAPRSQEETRGYVERIDRWKRRRIF